MDPTAPSAETPVTDDAVDRLVAEIAAERDEWRTDKRGNLWVPRNNGTPGRVFRQGDETVEDARQRDNDKLAGKPSPDPRPKSRARKTGPPKATDSDIESMLAEMLTMPAIPAKTLLNCDYCMNHFIVQGPQAAHQLVELSKANPALRRLLERLYTSWTSLTYGAVLAAYVGKPLLHHMAPQPVLDTAGPFLGVPTQRPDNVIPFARPPRPTAQAHTAHNAAYANPTPSTNGSDSPETGA